MHHTARLVLLGWALAQSLGACSWAGRATGEVVNRVEQGAREFGSSYDEARAHRNAP